MEALTFSSVARWLRNALISASPLDRGGASGGSAGTAQPVLIARHRAAGVVPDLQLLPVALDQTWRLGGAGHRWGAWALGVFPHFDNHQQQLFTTWTGDVPPLCLIRPTPYWQVSRTTGSKPFLFESHGQPHLRIGSQPCSRLAYAVHARHHQLGSRVREPLVPCATSRRHSSIARQPSMGHLGIGFPAPTPWVASPAATSAA